MVVMINQFEQLKWISKLSDVANDLNWSVNGLMLADKRISVHACDSDEINLLHANELFENFSIQKKELFFAIIWRCLSKKLIV